MEFDRKKIPSYVMTITILMVVVFFNVAYFTGHISVNSQNITDYALKDEDIAPVRETAVAGLFYPADLYQLSNDVDGYLENVPSTLSNRPKLMIVPHAGYRYSAQVAAFAYRRLVPFKDKIHRVFLLGPSHHVDFNGVALSKAKQFKTPLGLVKVDEHTVTELAQNNFFSFNTKAHKDEHALEVQLPFLQKTLDNFEIVPMLYGRADAKQISQVLAPYLNDDTSLLIISSDLSHYLDYDSANQTDKQSAQDVAAFVPVNHHQFCGATAVNVAMLLAKKFGLVPQLLDMVNSGDVSEDKNRVVGYGAWSYEESENEPELKGLDLEVQHLQNFARHNKAALLDIVKKSLQSAVTKGELFRPSRKDFNNVLFDKGASFVTLKQGKKLRGCIGSLYPHTAIALDLAQNTYSAALKDNRFSPVRADELNNLDFTISLLTDFEEIKFDSYDDLLSKIQPQIDGLLIKDGQREGVFLPTVWKEIPDKKDFVTQLKLKAGLSPSYWADTCKVFRFKTVEIIDDNN
jgi:hypothetical protein